MDETPRNEQGDRTAQCSIPAASTETTPDPGQEHGLAGSGVPVKVPVATSDAA